MHIYNLSKTWNEKMFGPKYKELVLDEQKTETWN